MSTNKPVKTDTQLLKIDDVKKLMAEYGIDLCHETIRRYVRRGKLPCIRSPKWLLFKREDVLNLLIEWGASVE